MTQFVGLFVSSDLYIYIYDSVVSVLYWNIGNPGQSISVLRLHVSIPCRHIKG